MLDPKYENDVKFCVEQEARYRASLASVQEAIKAADDDMRSVVGEISNAESAIKSNEAGYHHGRQRTYSLSDLVSFGLMRKGLEATRAGLHLELVSGREKVAWAEEMTKQAWSAAAAAVAAEVELIAKENDHRNGDTQLEEVPF